MAAPLTLDSVVAATRDHLASDLPDETVILSLSRGRYFGVDGVAREIWRMIQHPIQVRSVRDSITSQYDIAAPQIERDLLTFLEDLQTNELITVDAA